MMGQYALGIDIGSGSVKITVLSREGIIRATDECEYPTYYPEAGMSEQDPEDWCRACRGALNRIITKENIDTSEIKAISVDAATHTAVLLDSQKNIIRRAILWTDQRSTEEVAYLKEHYGNIIKKQVKNEPTTVWTLPQVMWVQKHEPSNWEKVRYILFAKDYLRYRLTGEMATDTIDAMGSMFFDAENECWSDDLCRAGNINREWLPDLYAPSDEMGSITKEAAAEFPLAEGTKVFIGSTDTVMEIFASGSVKTGQVTVKLATAGRICAVTTHSLPSPYVFNYRHIIPGLWYPGTGTACCAASYRWFRDTLGKEPYEILNNGAEKAAPGSDGLMFHPYLNGELTPYNDPLLRASFIGISSHHDISHFTRAVLEGVAFSLKDCLNVLLEMDVKMNRFRIIGGGAKGLLWRQIVSDVLDIRLEKVKVDDSSFGTAMLAAVGLGWFRDYGEAAGSCVSVDSVTEPDPRTREKYEELFVRYRKIHEALESIYHE